MGDNKTEYNCYCDANYTEEGLRKCMYQASRWLFYNMCDRCSNKEICPIMFNQPETIIKDIDFSWLDELEPISLPDDATIEWSPF